MAFIFYLIGWLVTVAGGIWSGLVILSAATTAQQVGNPGASILAAVVLALPGFGTVLSGLLLLAVGGGLARLDRIVENTSYAPAPRNVDTSRWSRADRERWEHQQR